jgi:hypothetical protein
MLKACLVLLSALCLSQTLHACPADTVPRAAQARC